MITVEELLKISKKGIDVELFLQTKLVTDEVDIEDYYLLLRSYKIQTKNKNKTNETFEPTEIKSYTNALNLEEIEMILDEMRNRENVGHLDFL